MTKNKFINKPKIDISKCPYFFIHFEKEYCSKDDYMGCMDRIKPCCKETCLWYSQQQVKELNLKMKKIEKLCRRIENEI